MAGHRCFALTIVDSDAFMGMPTSSQALYFHLGMRADDEGFVNNPKSIAQMIKASEDDLKLLMVKNFIIPFDSGIVVIKHWKIHNNIRKDRLNDTVYQEELALLSSKRNGAYTMSDVCLTDDGQMSDECRHKLSKDKLSKDKLSEGKVSEEYGTHKNVLLSIEEYIQLKEELGQDKLNKCIDFLDMYILEKNYKSDSHYAAIKRWVINAVDEREAKKQKPKSDNIFLDMFKEATQ